MHDPTNGVHIEAKNWWDSKHDVNPEARLVMAQEAIMFNTNSTFVLCPRGNGPSSMRLVEAMGCGAIPVLLDDWSAPFGTTMPFAVRWSLRHGDLDILLDVLKRMAADKAEVRKRLLQMHAFMASYHPIWRSARFLYTVLAEDVGLC